MRGFTLIEILIATSIVIGVMWLVSTFILDISQFQFFVGESLDVEQEVQSALKIIIPEVRSIGTANNGGYMISAASSSSFTFFSDIDNDNLLEQVRYFLDGTTLKKGVIKPGVSPYIYDPLNEKISEVVHNVTSANIFTYYNKNYDAINKASLPVPIDISAVRVVKIKLTVDKNPNQEPTPQTYSVTLEIRNLRGQ